MLNEITTVCLNVMSTFQGTGRRYPVALPQPEITSSQPLARSWVLEKMGEARQGHGRRFQLTGSGCEGARHGRDISKTMTYNSMKLTAVLLPITRLTPGGNGRARSWCSSFARGCWPSQRKTRERPKLLTRLRPFWFNEPKRERTRIGHWLTAFVINSTSWAWS